MMRRQRLALRTRRVIQLAWKMPRLRRVPQVRQMEEAECGAACLGMVLGYFGKKVPLEELRQATATGRDGTTALTIVQAARGYGLRARGVRAEVSDLRFLPTGSVLHWDFSHFVVLERTLRSGARIVDPAQGRYVVSPERLHRSYTGVAITFEPAIDFEPGRTAGRGTWRYLRPILRQSRNLVRVATTSLVLRLVALTLPLLTAMVVDKIVPRADRHLLLIFAGAAVLMLAYQFLASFLRANLLLELRTRLDLGLTLGFVDHLVDLPYAFFLRRSAGDLMMRMQSNTAVREILTSSSLSALLDGVFATLYLALLFIVSPLIGVLVVVQAGLQVATIAVVWRRSRRLMAEDLQAQADTQSYAYEMLSGIETLKACGAEQRAADRWSGLFAKQVNIELTRGRLTSAADSFTGTLNVGSGLFILLAGSLQVLSGQLSLGTMLSASALSAGFLGPISTLVGSVLQLQVVSTYMERINDVLDQPKEQAGQRVRAAATLTGRIKATSVSFRYSDLAPMVVRDVSVEIRPGQRIGIAGRSGSGKTTLAQLLLGIYQPVSGRIEFDGHDLATLDFRSVRRQLGIVTQHPYVFGSSIRENIALADPGLPLEAVVHAARLACIHDDIEAMPMGYDTPLADGGAGLSGGQRQRIALARALVTRPSVLLLDEATSDLDTVTEQQVYQNLASIAATTIVIAHRLSTLRNADLILVMEDGQIAEAGTHEELAALGERYWSLINAQAGLAGSGRGLPELLAGPSGHSQAIGEKGL